MQRKRINICGMSPMDLLDIFQVPVRFPVPLHVLFRHMGIHIKEDDFSHVEEEGHYLYGSVISTAVVQSNGIFLFHKYGLSQRDTKFLLSCELAYLCLYGGNHIGTMDWYQRDSNILDFVRELWIPGDAIQKVVAQRGDCSVEQLCEIFDCPEGMIYQKLECLMSGPFDE